MGRGFMFLPINLFGDKVQLYKQKGKCLYDRCKNKAAARALKYITDKINSADQTTIDKISDELIDMGESFYLAILHLKRLADRKYASRFFEKEKMYIFDGMTWLHLWHEEPIRIPVEIDFTKYKKRIPRGEMLFVINVKQEYIDHIVLQVIHNEDLGYISLGGDMALEPTKYFKRF